MQERSLCFSTDDSQPPPDKLMLVAHPDDEIIFGGHQLLTEKGWKVVVMTNGDNPRRREEFKAAMAAVGVAAWEIWSEEDALQATSLSPDIVARLKNLLAQPFAKVVTHNLDGEYGHRQHKLLSAHVHLLCPTDFFVFHQEPDRPWDTAIDEQKRAVLDCYPSQSSVFSAAEQTHKSAAEKRVWEQIDAFLRGGRIRRVTARERREKQHEVQSFIAYGAGMNALQEERLDAAVAHFQQAVAFQPTFDGYKMLGQTHVLLGRLPLALAAFEAAIVQQPDLEVSAWRKKITDALQTPP